MIETHRFPLSYNADEKRREHAECYGCDGEGMLYVVGEDYFTWRVACDNPECDYEGRRGKKTKQGKTKLGIQLVIRK